uniref:Uncharacterized protein n=1 Tax=Tanacetum cinerariifolium TaxID=118510 RepID=A0A699H0F4_TANCI|nr:hypothetical protein [Tanacetum cinerariifolium]
MVALVDELQVLDKIVAKQVLDMVVAEPLESVVVPEMGMVVVKQRIVVDNTESCSNKMESWQLKQSDLDTFVLLNELHWHELHVSLDVHTSDQSWWCACLLLI